LVTRIWPPAATAHPRRQVHDGADGGVLGPAVEADLATGRVGGGDLDAEREVVSAALPLGGQLGRAVAHRHGELHGSPRRIVEPHRVVEEDEQPVAGELGDRAVVVEDHRADGVMELAEHVHHLLRFGGLGEEVRSSILLSSTEKVQVMDLGSVRSLALALPGEQRRPERDGASHRSCVGGGYRRAGIGCSHAAYWSESDRVAGLGRRSQTGRLWVAFTSSGANDQREGFGPRSAKSVGRALSSECPDRESA